jgi:hypothetical protein
MGSSAAFLFARVSRMSNPFAFVAALSTIFASALVAPTAQAQVGGFGQQQAVGGVVIDSEGVLRAATLDQRQAALKAMRQSIGQPQGDLAQPAELRMVSLAKLQLAMQECAASGQPLSDEMRHLAGIQRIEFVFVYPERNDIVLAGPAEPWIVRDDASVVGVNSGRPVMKLDDLIVALRSVEPARTEGITCSIEPTEEGRVRLQSMLKRINLRPGQNPSTFEPAMREAFGPQMIKLTGVPGTSHYARTLVAADYQMKRLAMALEDSPVAGLPSYLALSRSQRHSSQSNPRWWMACNYDALSHTDDKLAWRISGQGVKTLTETDLITADGKAQPGQKADKFATLWAETMTQKFDDLTKAQPIFGELRNCFDLSVVATLIVQEQLAQRANCDLAHLLGNNVEIELNQFSIPKSVEPQCSFVRGASGWVVTASGGVDVNAFEVVQSQQVDAAVADVRARAAKSGESQSWWWNG